MRTESVWEKLTQWSIYGMLLSFSFSKALIEISFTAALVSWVISKVRKRSLPCIPWNVSSGLLGVFILLSFSSVFVSQYPRESLRGLGKLLEQILFFAMVIDTFRSKDEIRKLLVFALAGMALTFVDGVYQFIVGKDFLRGRPLSWVDVNKRLVGPFNDHALFASYILGWAPLFLVFVWKPVSTGWKWKLAIALVVVLGLFCLFHTQARGAWLGFVVSLCFLALLQKKKIVILPLAISVLVVMLFLPRNMIIHPDIEGKEQSLIERGVLWMRALDVIMARPLLGTGINTYTRSHEEFDKAKSWRVQRYYAHNSFLQLAAERGLPALVALLGFIFSFFWNGIFWMRKTADPDIAAFLQGVMASLAALLVLALVDTVFEPIQPVMLLWLILGLGFSALRIAIDNSGVASACTATRGVTV